VPVPGQPLDSGAAGVELEIRFTLSPDASEPDGTSLLGCVRLPFYYVCGGRSAVISPQRMKRIDARCLVDLNTGRYCCPTDIISCWIGHYC
jgi:hypothetical protein